MGISKNMAECVARELARDPFLNNVILVGRQTVEMTPLEAVLLARQCGLGPVVSHEDLEIDKSTRASAGNNYITDSAFLTVLGVAKENICAIDVDDYEGAELIHDLNQPLPQELFGVADLVIDGSTIDNVFDPASALRNLTNLLRERGRLITCNVGSNLNCPYVIPTPFWFYDYFVVNGFEMAEVYVIVEVDGETNVLLVSPSNERPRPPAWNPNIAGDNVTIVSVARKGGRVNLRSPVQHQYRSDKEWDFYLEQQSRMSSSGVDHMTSTVPVFVHVPPGYVFLEPQANG